MIYISSTCLKENRIDSIIHQLSNYGIRNIELSGGTEFYACIEQDLNNLKARYGLEYACHAYFPPPQEPFVVNLASCNDVIYRKSVNYYVQSIELLKRIECKSLSIHAGFLIEVDVNQLGKKVDSNIIYNEGKAYDRFCTAYDHISGLCAENGIELFLENNVLSAENYQDHSSNYFMMTDFASIRKMMNQIHFNLLLDLGHLYVSSHTLGLDYSEECENLKKYVKWVHISENSGVVDEHRPLRKNSKILSEFYKMNHSMLNITLETVGELEDIVKSIELIKGGC